MSAVQFILSSIIIFLQEDNVQLQQMENELVRRPSKEARINVNAKEKFWHIDFEIWTISPTSWASIQAQN